MTLINTVSESIKSISNARKNVSQVLNEVIEGMEASNKKLISFLLSLKNPRSIGNALGGEVFYRLYRNGSNISEDELNLIQRIGFLSIRFLRISDDIIDNDIDKIDEKDGFIFQCLKELKGDESEDVRGYESLKVKRLILLTRKLSSEVLNLSGEYNLFIDMYSILADYVSSELMHKELPSINTPELNEVIENIYSEVDKFSLTEEEKISVKIAIGVGAFTTGVVMPLILMDLSKDEDLEFIKNMFYLGGAMQMMDDLYDREKDIKSGKVSFATKANMDRLSEFNRLQDKLYKIGYNGLSDYQKRIIDKFKFFFDLYTKTYGKSYLLDSYT